MHSHFYIIIRLAGFDNIYLVVSTNDRQQPKFLLEHCKQQQPKCGLLSLETELLCLSTENREGLSAKDSDRP